MTKTHILSHKLFHLQRYNNKQLIYSVQLLRPKHPSCSDIGTVRVLRRRYRKMISNVCEGGVNKQQSFKQHACPLLPPRGLRVGIKGQMLAVAPGDDITFIVHQEQVCVCVCVCVCVFACLSAYRQLNSA